MKKKLTVLLLALCLVIGLVGCSEAMVHSEISFYKGGGGTKTITVRVWGDKEAVPGRGGTPDNNTAFMLINGEELAAKLATFCTVEGVSFKVTNGKSNDKSTYVTMTYDFTSIADYNAKSKLIAGKNSTLWKDATLVVDGGNATYTEEVNNITVLYLELFEKYFADFDCYPVYEYGPNTSSQHVPNGIKFENDGTMYSFMYWIVPSSVRVNIGDTSEKKVIYDETTFPENRGDLSGTITATGELKDKPIVEENPEEKPEDKPEEKPEDKPAQSTGCGSMAMPLVATALIVLAAIGVVLIKRGKRNEEK